MRRAAIASTAGESGLRPDRPQSERSTLPGRAFARSVTRATNLTAGSYR